MVKKIPVAYNGRMRFTVSLPLAFLLALVTLHAQDRRSRGDSADAPATVLKPARVFDGEAMHEGWAVRVRGERIEAAGPAASIDAAGAKVVDLPGTTLMPGLVEGHSHILLHAYNETPWNDQVAHEGLALRAARAVNHLRATLMAGFTTIRDLGTEGAGYADVELKQAVNQGIIPGPRMLASTRAIVATGSYAPKGFALGMARAAGRRGGRRRRQPDARGARPDRPRRRLDQAVRRLSLGSRAGRASHVFAGGNEAGGGNGAQRRRAGGRAHQPRRKACAAPFWPASRPSSTAISGTPEVFKLMAEHHVALCPTLAAGDATAQYAGWRKGEQPEPPGIQRKRASFKAALDAGVTILSGSDVGVFAHGENAREIELMVALRHAAGGRAEGRDVGSGPGAAHGYRRR